MSGTSAGGLIIMCVVIVTGLALMLGLVLYAVRHPHWRRPKIDVYDKPGDVRGGVHVGDPGSVAPTRDEPVNPPERDVPPARLTAGTIGGRARPAAVRRPRAPTLEPVRRRSAAGRQQ